MSSLSGQTQQGEMASQEMSKSDHEPAEKMLFRTEYELNLELVSNHSFMHH